MTDTFGIAALGAGLLLLFAAVRNVSPVDLFRSALDPSRADDDPDPIHTPASSSAAASGSSRGLAAAGRSSKDVDDLAEPLRSRTRALLDEAGGRVWIVSGVRSTAEQTSLRRKHCGTTQYAIYEKPSNQCSPPTAVPGTSKHETGQAVDLGGDLHLAARLGAKHGMVRTVPGEAWHFEAV